MEGSWKFRLAPYVIGFYEEQWDIMDHELAHLCEQYWCEGDAEGIMRPHPALHRVVPAHQSLKTEIILPYDDVKPLILQAKAFELRDCICRKQMDLVGKRKCNFPSRVCLNFSMRERPTGEYSITQEEALKVLDECEEVGLVHTVSNAAKGVFYVCNCCGICEERCQVKACSIEDGVATIDLSKCIGCGLCVT
jgi:ferredoxin